MRNLFPKKRKIPHLQSFHLNLEPYTRSSGADEPSLFGGVPATALSTTDTFSVRWSGFIRPKNAQIHEVRADTEGGVWGYNPV